MHTKIDITAK